MLAGAGDIDGGCKGPGPRCFIHHPPESITSERMGLIVFVQGLTQLGLNFLGNIIIPNFYILLLNRGSLI